LNKNQTRALYEHVFSRLLKRYQSIPGQRKFRFKNPLYSLGASAIDLSLSVFPWAVHRDDTANVKLSVGLITARRLLSL
jgi:putative transposase